MQETDYNPFYGLVLQKFLAVDPVNYKYTFKYVLWDYLKGLSKLTVRQIANLGKICGELMGLKLVPLHFLKVIDFDFLDKP